MFEQSKVFPNLVGLSALLIAGSAAFFSVFGLSKLFAGASLSVIIMAGSLEFGKLVAASFLYRYWKKINFLHKTYMTIAVITLVLITSAGIFGFLSNAYQGATVQFEKESTTLLFKEERLKQLQEDKVFLKEELDAGIADLPNNYRTARRKLREDYQPLILEINQKMLDVKVEIGDLKTALVETGVDVGPAIYIARTFGTDIDTVVKFFIFILIFVFDPMAVIFVLSYNVILQDRYETSKNGRSEKRKNGKKWWEVYGEKEKKKIQENFNQAVKNDKRFDKSEELIEEPEDIKEEERVKLFRGAFSRKKSEKK